MAYGDHVIYTSFKGKMTRIAEPKGDPEKHNFVITWLGRDWSGFRTLADCEKQFDELEKRSEGRDRYQVVER